MMNGSTLLEGYIPEVDATIVTRILDAGTVVQSFSKWVLLQTVKTEGKCRIIRHSIRVFTFC